MSKGVEAIEAVKESLKELVIAGKKIGADGKVGVDDLAVLIALLPKTPAMLESFKQLGEAFDEVKDVDVAEAIALIQSFHKAIKEIEAA